MKMLMRATLGLTLAATAAQAQVNAGEQPATPDAPFTVTKLGDFNLPWRIAVLPDGQLLVTEKVGPLWIVSQAPAGRGGGPTLRRVSVGNVPTVVAQGQRGQWTGVVRLPSGPGGQGRWRARWPAGLAGLAAIGGPARAQWGDSYQQQQGGTAAEGDGRGDAQQQHQAQADGAQQQCQDAEAQQGQQRHLEAIGPRRGRAFPLQAIHHGLETSHVHSCVLPGARGIGPVVRAMIRIDTDRAPVWGIFG